MDETWKTKTNDTIKDVAPPKEKDEGDLQLEKTRLALEKSAEHARLGVLYFWHDITVESCITKEIDYLEDELSKKMKTSPTKSNMLHENPGIVSKNASVTCLEW